MARRRYADIERADELKALKDKLDLHRKRTPGEKSVLYRQTLNARSSKIARAARAIGWVSPFGVSNDIFIATALPTNTAPQLPTSTAPGGGVAVDFESSSDVAAKLIAIPAFSTRVSVAKPGAGKYIMSFEGGDKPNLAKVILKESSGTATVQTSRTTGDVYVWRDSKSVSSPFGSKVSVTNDNYEAAVTEIKDGLPAPTGSVKYSVSFIPQGTIGAVKVA